MNLKKLKKAITEPFSNKKKGQVGMQLFVGIIVSIFMIGLIVFTFVIMGENMIDQVTDETAITAINDTIVEVADVPDWFGLFILMGAMVVIILMVVMIISAIRQANVGSGGMGG